jgi:hypothetical protein
MVNHIQELYFELFTIYSNSIETSICFITLLYRDHVHTYAVSLVPVLIYNSKAPDLLSTLLSLPFLFI